MDETKEGIDKQNVNHYNPSFYFNFDSNNTNNYIAPLGDK